MIIEILLIIFIIRYIRKYLPAAIQQDWNKWLIAGIAAAIVLLLLEMSNMDYFYITTWATHAMLLGLVYIGFTSPVLRFLKSLLYAVLPFIAVVIVTDWVKIFFGSFFNKWNNYFDAAIFFTIVWMIAIWFIQKKQRKALEKEKLKIKEIEKEQQLTEKLKAALEVQVAERTAALTQQKEELQLALKELKETQTQLIHSEKMASLGELTAGVAHEIQNPLNFVNNFSEVSSELIKEMMDEMAKGDMQEVEAIAHDVMQNLEKINHHGKRADAIVKGMLQHSRSSTGVKEATDINELCDEYLRLSYHGLRAKDKSFNAAMQTDWDASVGKINIVPQDMGRVVLNLLTNAFYAVTEKKGQSLQGYEPTVSVATKKDGNKVYITVKDNGNGIPQKVLDKIFQPFFTTKPAGQGTGLGLSLSYDIITKGHGGELKVETKEGEGTNFIISLPLKPAH